jgi:hypothetical protein
MTRVFFGRPFDDREAQIEYHVKIEAEVGAMHLQTKPCCQPPEATREGWHGFRRNQS